MLLVPAPYSGPTSVQHPLSHNFRNFILHFFSEFLLVYNGSVVMNLPGDAGATGDMGLIPGLGRSPRGGNGNPLHILAWEIPWTEELGGLKSMG